MLNGVPDGVSYRAQVLNLVMSAFLCHSLLTEADYATTLTKAFAVFWFASGLQCRLAPEAGIKAWGGSDDPSSANKFCVKVMGQNLASLSVYMLSIANGVDPLKAIGYWLAGGALSIAGFILDGKEIEEEVGLPVSKLYPWVVILGVAAATLAF